MSINKLTTVGRLTADPVLSQANDAACASFIYTGERHTRAGRQRRLPDQFLPLHSLAQAGRDLRPVSAQGRQSHRCRRPLSAPLSG